MEYAIQLAAPVFLAIFLAKWLSDTYAIDGIWSFLIIIGGVILGFSSLMYNLQNDTRRNSNPMANMLNSLTSPKPEDNEPDNDTDNARKNE